MTPFSIGHIHHVIGGVRGGLVQSCNLYVKNMIKAKRTEQAHMSFKSF